MQSHNKKISALVIFALTLILINSCFRSSLHLNTRAVGLHTEYETPAVIHRPSLRNPRKYNLELVWQVDNIKPVSSQPTQSSEYIFDNTTMKLNVWAIEPINRRHMRQIIFHSLSPDGSYSIEDRINGNRIRVWDLSYLLEGKKSIEIKENYSFLCYEMDFEISPENIGEYDKTSEFYQFYTKEEVGLELHSDEILTNITEKQKNPLKKIFDVFNWLYENQSSDHKVLTGASTRLFQKQWNLVYEFIALCREIGIPSRLVSGLYYRENTNFEPHFWAECFIPNYGWIPVDIMIRNHQIGFLDNRHFTGTKGLNIYLPNAPKTNFSNDQIRDQKIFNLPLIAFTHTGFTGTFKLEIEGKVLE